MKIEVIGPGCPRCQKTTANVKKALEKLESEFDGTVKKVEDDMEIIERGVMHTPAVALNGEVETEGEIPDVDQLVEIFDSA
ncbi:thioredoxin family protein [Halodesulfurarchaeum sp.]|uniref:thioredoxin family protein n=1 Tax=Halodesulfurarchaeum sp. TaxID=1980530 RepID=UPI001BC1A29C|nr:thioredoxin family protein [Halodesulfurarchaeum sp.]